MSKSLQFFYPVAALLAALLSVPTQASATIVVGSCLAGTRYTTIQEAVNSSAPGSVIKVCPANYAEQVVISKNLTLQGVASGVYGAPVIGVPAGGLVANDGSWAAQVLIVDSNAVNLTNLAIDGVGNQLVSCGGISAAGVLYHNASGVANKLTVRNQIIANAPHGCDGSRGMVAMVDSPLTGEVTIENSNFRNYGREGIYANQAGLTMHILNNSLAGVEGAHHSGNAIALNGGATGTVTGNTIANENWIDNVFPDFGGSAWGVLIGCASGATVSGNTITDTQAGIVLNCATSNNNVISGNKIFNTKGYDAIYVAGNNNLVQKNTIMGAGEAGVHVDSSRGGGLNNTVTNNNITETCAGILLSPGVTGNTTKPNTFSGVYITTFASATCGPLF